MPFRLFPLKWRFNNNYSLGRFHHLFYSPSPLSRWTKAVHKAPNRKPVDHLHCRAKTCAESRSRFITR
jgi:hypothetical protein